MEAQTTFQDNSEIKCSRCPKINSKVMVYGKNHIKVNHLFIKSWNIYNDDQNVEYLFSLVAHCTKRSIILHVIVYFLKGQLSI